MSKHLHVIITDETHKALSDMSHYRGELSHIVRAILENFVNDAKQLPKTIQKKLKE